MQLKRPVSVLVAPLDWGLGHATRCIPIINELIERGARVIVAASGSQKTLLKLEFPQLEFAEIPGYDITYNQGGLLKWGIILSLPSIFNKIRKENRWLAEMLRHQQIDAVIADNRYGLFNKNIYSVFMTHQLGIQTGLVKRKKVGSRQLAINDWIEKKVMKWNYKLIEKFSSCWVPDQTGDLFFAGKLSHPQKLPAVRVKYIGILSRFQLEKKKTTNNSLLILISGPEPQRTSFEKILLEQLYGFNMKAVLVRGLPGSAEMIYPRENIIIYNHLSSNEINALLNESDFIIARAGYSTIMDLVKVKKSAILIPTPGQTEQEYLGQYLHERKWMYCVPEDKFNLKEAISGFEKSGFTPPDIQDSSLKDAVTDFLKQVRHPAYSGS